MRFASQSQNARPLRGYMLLGAITPQQALQQAISASGVNSKTIPANTQALILADIQAGYLQSPAGQNAYIPGTSQCSASGSSGAANDLQLAGKAGSLGLTGATTAGLVAAGPATFGISIAIAGIVGLFSTLLNHHSQAVQKEQSVLCSAVPAANNYLSIISQGVANGQATPADAIKALNSLSSDFDSAVSSIRKMGGGSCNAACVMTEMLRGIVAYQTSLYQDMEKAPATVAAPPVITLPNVPAAVATVTSGGPTTAAPVSSGSVMVLPATTPAATAAPATSLSQLFSGNNWLPIAAVAVAAFFLAEVL